ncbi:MAG: hypothetical protein AAFQ80_05535 [Cyanobacteria bacterium J06621_8]
MSKKYNHEIGYESLLADFELYKKQTPRGVSLAKKKSGIYLQFKTPNKARSQYNCNCPFTIDGMRDAVGKARLVGEKLASMTSETEFWEWFKKEVQEENQLINDVLTFGETIQKVENDFWSRPSRTKRKRDKSSSSDIASWQRTYGCFYKHLPEYKTVNLTDIQKAINKQTRDTRSYKYAVSAMKKLVRTINRSDILGVLDELNTTQTENAELQTITLEDFLAWKNEALGVTVQLDGRHNLEGRKAWVWTFSMQVVYGLRVGETFAIKNLFESYVTKDGVNIPALNDPSNTSNLIYIGDKTNLGTTVKTGSRIARPSIPPRYPNLIEILDIKNPMLPSNKPTSKNHKNISDFYANTARMRLRNWNAPVTQTHAFRHLANINGIQAGIPQEVRAQSLGHTVQMNESVYKKRQSTQTTIDLLLNSNSNAIDFVTALGEAKKLVTEDELNRDIVARLLSIIYQKDSKVISELL